MFPSSVRNDFPVPDGQAIKTMSWQVTILFFPTPELCIGSNFSDSKGDHSLVLITVLTLRISRAPNFFALIFLRWASFRDIFLSLRSKSFFCEFYLISLSFGLTKHYDQALIRIYIIIPTLSKAFEAHNSRSSSIRTLSFLMSMSCIPACTRSSWQISSFVICSP